MDFTPVASPIKPTEPLFNEEAAQLISALNEVEDLQKLLSVSEKLADKSRQEYIDWPKSEQSMAMYAYVGDVYAGLDSRSLTAKEQSKAVERVRTLSGLYGYVRPSDSLRRYRLELKTKLAGEWGANLYDFWGSRIADALIADRPDLVINATSNEYMKALTKHLPKDLKIIEVKFLQIYPDGQQKDVTIFTKRARGLMARYMCKLDKVDLAALKKFDLEGYHFDKQEGSRLVFSRLYPA